jgi:alkylation response protein AidB-like acyl-CoA dehydrogenase
MVNLSMLPMHRDEFPLACASARCDAYEAVLAAHLDDWATREAAEVARGARRLAPDSIAELRSSGILAAPIPRSLDGAGASLAQTVCAVRRIARVAPSTALCLAMPLGNAGNTRIGDDAVLPAQRSALARGRAWIAHEARAGRILAVANSEPGSSGELANTRTRASSDDAGRIFLTGKKSFATLGPDADYFLCTARRDGGELDAFFVARSAAGLTLADDWDALGMRATASVGITLEHAEAAAVFVYPSAITSVNARHWSTLLLAAVFVGVGEGALEVARRSIASSASWARSTLVEALLGIEAAGAWLDTVAAGEAIPCPAGFTDACMRVKTFAVRAALEASTRALTVCGGRAYTQHHPVARFLLDAAAGPLLRPPLPQAMDAIAAQLWAEVPSRP